MAILWFSVNGELVAQRMAPGTFALTGPAGQPAQVQEPLAPPAAPALLLGWADASQETWVCLEGNEQDVRINGEQLPLGLRVLRHKDEILIAAQRLFFSTERLARVESFTGAAPADRCPRCTQPIPAGGAAVQCPACGGWHHQSADLPCWTYTAHCALCDQPTALNADYGWTPEDL